jgi:hypothetical protein
MDAPFNPSYSHVKLNNSSFVGFSRDVLEDSEGKLGISPIRNVVYRHMSLQRSRQDLF